MKLFLGFVFISGIGWLLDIVSYAGLTQFLEMAPSHANVVSSMIGVTYVWIVAINRLFDRREYGKSIYLPVYWCYQGMSILAYSTLISIFSASVFNPKLGYVLGIPFAVMAKIIITVPNLLTNFIFMNILARLMKPGTQ